MATIYKVLCETGGQSVELEITDSLNPLPGSDIWKCNNEDAWGLDGGSVANWGTSSTYLHGVGAAPIALLSGFSKKTTVNDTGTGEKIYPEGSFPSGEFNWTCTKKD